jgi:protein involved in polysaccharide export with SLBB domain
MKARKGMKHTIPGGFGLHGARDRSGAAALLLCAALLLAAGCAGDQQVRRLSAPLPGAGLVDEYVLQPYDSLEIKFLHNPELNEVVTVRPDGMISLQMIDEVRAAGITPSQLDSLLTQKYALLLDRAMITVFVRSFNDQKVYVGGEVYAPRAIPLKERMNALQAVFMAGGFKPDARTSQVMIISRGPDNRPMARRVNLKRALKGRPAPDDYRLKACDIVFVPKTSLAKADRFMTHLYSFLPRQVFLSFDYELSNEPVELETP